MKTQFNYYVESEPLYPVRSNYVAPHVVICLNKKFNSGLLSKATIIAVNSFQAIHTNGNQLKSTEYSVSKRITTL